MMYLMICMDPPSPPATSIEIFVYYVYEIESICAQRASKIKMKVHMGHW